MAKHTIRVTELLDIHNNAERNTVEFITTLASDFESLVKRMLASAKRGHVSPTDASHARNLVRTLFALVEGAVFVMKIEALFTAEEQGAELLFQEAALVFERRQDLNDRGEIVERPANITLERNIRFAFRICSQVFKCSNTLDTNSDWWHALQRSRRVRDRLMHPRLPGDLDIGPKEIIDAITAQRGFMKATLDLLRSRPESV
jgi:hypothetical protein